MPGPIAGSSAACQSRDGAAKKAGADHTERGVGVVQAERVVVLDLSLHRTPCFFAGPHLISTILKPPEPRVSREGGVCATCQEELPEFSWNSRPSVSASPPTPKTRPGRQGAVVNLSQNGHCSQTEPAEPAYRYRPLPPGDAGTAGSGASTKVWPDAQACDATSFR